MDKVIILLQSIHYTFKKSNTQKNGEISITAKCVTSVLEDSLQLESDELMERDWGG